MKELTKANKLYNEKIKEEKRNAAARAKEEREQKRVEERAAIDARKEQRRRDKEARDAQKATRLPNKGKRKASTAPAPKTTKKRRTVAAVDGAIAPSPPPAPRTHTTCSGRTATRNY